MFGESKNRMNRVQSAVFRWRSENKNSDRAEWLLRKGQGPGLLSGSLFSGCVFHFFPDPLHFFLGSLLQRNQLVVSLAGGTDQLVEFHLKGGAFAVLGVLDEKHHQEGHNGGARVYDQLPCVRVLKEWAGNRPRRDHKAAESESERAASEPGHRVGNSGEGRQLGSAAWRLRGSLLDHRCRRSWHLLNNARNGNLDAQVDRRVNYARWVLVFSSWAFLKTLPRSWHAVAGPMAYQAQTLARLSTVSCAPKLETLIERVMSQRATQSFLPKSQASCSPHGWLGVSSN